MNKRTKISLNSKNSILDKRFINLIWFKRNLKIVLKTRKNGNMINKLKLSFINSFCMPSMLKSTM
jgi:hypothetical protein